MLISFGPIGTSALAPIIRSGVGALGSTCFWKLAGTAESGATDADTLQQGDQSAPDNVVASESGQSESESGVSDGPGGYADSNANADTQQQGEN